MFFKLFMCNKKIKLLFAENWVKVNLFWIPDSFYLFPVIELLGFLINFSIWLIGFQFKKLSWYLWIVQRTFRQCKIESESKTKIGENFPKSIQWKSWCENVSLISLNGGVSFPSKSLKKLKREICRKTFQNPHTIN